MTNAFLNKWKSYQTVDDELKELVDPQSVSTSSFEVQDSLHPEFWSPEGKLEPKVRKRLIRIAKNFIKDLELPELEVLDLTFTGSLANYNWSTHSDIDLHIIVDFSALQGEQELLNNYFNAKRAYWNLKHAIVMHDFEVEIYIQDSSEPHTASGLYSVYFDEWINKPQKQDPVIDHTNIKVKAAGLMDQIDKAQEMFNAGAYKKVIEHIEKLREKIKKFRASGLNNGGEYSIENLAFKALRRNGYLGKLSDLRIASYDELMSLHPQMVTILVGEEAE